jgi:hypothetical protein
MNPIDIQIIVNYQHMITLFSSISYTVNHVFISCRNIKKNCYQITIHVYTSASINHLKMRIPTNYWFRHVNTTSTKDPTHQILNCKYSILSIEHD